MFITFAFLTLYPQLIHTTMLVFWGHGLTGSIVKGVKGCLCHVSSSQLKPHLLLNTLCCRVTSVSWLQMDVWGSNGVIKWLPYPREMLVCLWQKSCLACLPGANPKVKCSWPSNFFCCGVCVCVAVALWILQGYHKICKLFKCFGWRGT